MIIDTTAYKKYSDEVMAHFSPNLFSSYEARVRRIRILGAAVFNWLLLGFAILLHLEFTFPLQYISIIIISIGLSILCLNAWKSLYKRAYEFRKEAIDIIQENIVSKESSTVRPLNQIDDTLNGKTNE